jgi:hypothetical protein
VATRQFAWPDRSARVRFQNVDYRVTLSVDGDELLQTGDDYGPDVAALMRAYADRTNLPKPTVRIEARQQSAVVSHVGLFRDVYYTNSDRRLAWATPGSPIELGADEFFTCGDNSLVSEDGRYWRQPIRLPEEDLVVEAGRVPRRFMLGKAFFVYWPAGYRPVNGAPGMTPNFGEMRFIH